MDLYPECGSDGSYQHWWEASFGATGLVKITIRAYMMARWHADATWQNENFGVGSNSF